MKYLAHFTKSAAAGGFIVIGCTTLLSGDNRLFGAVVFVVALCSICSLALPLYTGAAGFARSGNDFTLLLAALLGNIAGCFTLGALVGLSLPDISALACALVERKMYPIHIGLLLSFVCGLLMYTAVYTYRTKQTYIGILTCVPAFIIAGFEHSIAYMGYMGLGLNFTPDALVNMLVFVIGNGLGAICLGFVVNLSVEKKQS